MSLSFFQIGMYAWMLAIWFIFSGHIVPNMAFYWFTLQVGMVLGLLTTMPVNWVLLKTGLKVACAH